MKIPTAIFQDQDVYPYIDRGGLGAEKPCGQLAYVLLPARRSTGKV